MRNFFNILWMLGSLLTVSIHQTGESAFVLTVIGAILHFVESAYMEESNA